jgi:hypothetical protein
VLPVQELLVVDELGARRAHQLSAEMLVLQQIQHVKALGVPATWQKKKKKKNIN